MRGTGKNGRKEMGNLGNWARRVRGKEWNERNEVRNMGN